MTMCSPGRGVGAFHEDLHVFHAGSFDTTFAAQQGKSLACVLTTEDRQNFSAKNETSVRRRLSLYVDVCLCVYVCLKQGWPCARLEAAMGEESFEIHSGL